MVIRSRTVAWAFGFVLASAVGLAALPLAAQEPTGSKPADGTKAPVTKKAVDPSRRVPPHFGQIGLTPEQKEEIYKIRARHQAQIDSLQKQVARAQAEMLAECESHLTESQKQLLTHRRDAAARAKQAKAATTETPVASKAADKSSN
ncbi:MAG: hypothetical protein LC745_13735 [Planctomycetia bacterium]|nr:hypothetical protein [Planctomycetia bacterium]